MNICVFCGSSEGNSPDYAKTAKELGNALAQQHHTLIYGGGNIGLMGILADAVLMNRGKAIGIIPGFLKEREVGHEGLSRLEIVPTMHERKKRMAELSDGFIAIPGGWGTLEELAEILTWKQLGLIHQPVFLINVNGFFNPLLKQMKMMVRDGFLKQQYFDFLQVVDSVSELTLQLNTD